MCVPIPNDELKVITIGDEPNPQGLNFPSDPAPSPVAGEIDKLYETLARLGLGQSEIVLFKGEPTDGIVDLIKKYMQKTYNMIFQSTIAGPLCTFTRLT